MEKKTHSLKQELWLTLGALGVVFGDIGTSPLYAMRQSALAAGGAVPPPFAVYGALSLIFWALIIVVTIKYVGFIMRADNNGEGGVMALAALAHRSPVSRRAKTAVGIAALLGLALFYGDGMLTPAISVLSALEGISVGNTSFAPFVVPLTLVVLVGLFAMQSRGTEKIGKLFGPVMVLWFVVLAVLGAAAILKSPQILRAVNPMYGVMLFVREPWTAFVALGSVVLAVTGCEALYADMGHFGARAIRWAWLYFALPSLLLNYFGQGALVLADPAAIENPFFVLCPEILRLPMVLLATAATVIASQAVISGAYSMTRQCMQLGFLPRMTVRHTSAAEEGQIFVPQINSALLVGVLILVLAFRTSDALAAAYGIAVTGTFICTCVLAIVVFRRQFHWSRTATVLAFGAFLIVDGIFFAANIMKVPEGGYVPLVLGFALIAIMTSWHRGRELLLTKWRAESLRLDTFLARLPQSRTVRVPGMGIFMTGNPEFVPTALLHNLKHNKVLHERVLFVTVHNEDFPEVPTAERSTVKELAPGIHQVVIRYGFMESPNLPRDLAALQTQGLDFNPMQASYFLGRETLVADTVPKMPLWRLWLFLVMARNAVSATEFFRIPSDRVVELGVRVAI